MHIIYPKAQLQVEPQNQYNFKYIPPCHAARYTPIKNITGSI